MRLVLFFVLNFGALALGSYLMGEGPLGSWYTNLNKAPWTPPGWVFGASWTLIMICLSLFMNKAVQVEKHAQHHPVGLRHTTRFQHRMEPIIL